MTISRRIERDRAIARIEAVRTAAAITEETDPLSGAYVLMATDAPHDFPDPEPYHPDLNELFHVINGARCGGVILYNDDEITESVNPDELDDGEHWQCVGEIAQIPVFLSRTDGTIWHAVEANDENWPDIPMTQIADDIWSFVAWYAMGPGYREFFKSDKDMWTAFLRENGFLDWENPE